jgi:hypothetical protein
VTVGTADDAALVALLADALPLAVALPGFDGLGSVGSCPRVADAAANELVRRWWVLPADLVHHQAWWAGFLFGPRIAPEPSAADTIAVLRTRLLAPGSETTAERIAALLAEGPADPLIGLLPALDPESRVTETSGQVPRQDLRWPIGWPGHGRSRRPWTRRRRSCWCACSGPSPRHGRCSTRGRGPRRMRRRGPCMKSGGAIRRRPTPWSSPAWHRMRIRPPIRSRHGSTIHRRSASTGCSR